MTKDSDLKLLVEALAPFMLDATDLDMLKRGDMLGPKTGARFHAAISRLVQDVSRCHARLEIDHYFKLGDDDDSDLERIDIPYEERADFPDAVEAREATIALLEKRSAVDGAEIERLREALKPFAEYAPYVEMFVEGRAKFGGSPVLPTKHFRLADFVRARAAIQPDTGER